MNNDGVVIRLFIRSRLENSDRGCARSTIRSKVVIMVIGRVSPPCSRVSATIKISARKSKIIKLLSFLQSR